MSFYIGAKVRIVAPVRKAREAIYDDYEWPGMTYEMQLRVGRPDVLVIDGKFLNGRGPMYGWTVGGHIWPEYCLRLVRAEGIGTLFRCVRSDGASFEVRCPTPDDPLSVLCAVNPDDECALVSSTATIIKGTVGPHDVTLLRIE